MESPTLVFLQLQAFKSISQIKTLPLLIRFTWIQFPSSWLELSPPQREPCHSSSWMLSLMQLVDHSKDFLLHSEPKILLITTCLFVFTLLFITILNMLFYPQRLVSSILSLIISIKKIGFLFTLQINVTIY